MERLSIIKNIKSLYKKCKEVSIEEGLQIGIILENVLGEHYNGVGLAANQIGIDARVCLIKVKEPLLLINPVITFETGQTSFEEGCLSFPGDYILTRRSSYIKVKADNHKEELHFSFLADPLECVCVQHEIDHLNGITMYDRRLNKESEDGDNI